MTKLPVLSVDLYDAVEVHPGRLAFLPTEALHRAVEAYRKFFFLAGRFPEKLLAPTLAIDEVWHLHMLHPEAYYQDCMDHLGYLMDHDAGFGFTPEEHPALLKAFQETADLWAATFGEAYRESLGSEDTTNCSKKETNCSKKEIEPTNCSKKEIEPTNCSKKEIEPTNCSKKELEPTNCSKLRLGGETLGPLSADLVQAALRSEGPLGRLEEKQAEAVLSGYLTFLTDLRTHPDLRPTAALVEEMWQLHMLHPVAYRRDCLAVLGYVLDHRCSTVSQVESQA